MDDSSGNLIGAGLVLGAGALTVGSLFAYKTAENMGMNGWIGPAGLAVMAGTVPCLAYASKVSRTQRERRAVERAQVEWEQFREQFPYEVHYAVDLLSDDFAACTMWTNPQIGIGLPARPGFSGSWPVPVWGHDPGHAPDPGMRISPVGLRVRLKMPQGFSADHIRNRLNNLASSLHVPKVQVVAAPGDHIVTIELRINNPLSATVKFPGPEPSPVPLKSLRVAMREDGEFYRLRLWNNHLFMAGVTGSGKSGVLWSIIGALAPDIKAGRVELHVIDLKRGGEMAAGYRLYSSWAYLVADAIAVLEKLLRIMRARLDERREHAMRTGEPIRNHEATVGDPHHVLLIDEIIALVELVGDVKGQFDVPQIDGTFKQETIRVDKYIGRLLMELLSQSRAVGFSLIAATQNAAKAIFDLLRDMFSETIGLRQSSAQQVQMTFGTGAAERGIDATAITVDEAGTAYIDSPETGGMAQRIRFFRVEDEDIRHLVQIFGRPADAPALPAPTETPSVSPAESAAADEGGNVVAFTPLVEQAQAAGDGVSRCLYCGRELTPTPGGGRPPKFCQRTDHRQQYHRLKKRMEQQKTS